MHHPSAQRSIKHPPIELPSFIEKPLIWSVPRLRNGSREDAHHKNVPVRPTVRPSKRPIGCWPGRRPFGFWQRCRTHARRRRRRRLGPPPQPGARRGDVGGGNSDLDAGNFRRILDSPRRSSGEERAGRVSRLTRVHAIYEGRSQREGLSGFKEQPDSPKHNRARQVQWRDWRVKKDSSRRTC